MEALTFADIEEEFDFPKPLTNISKEIILEKFKTLENYREFLTIRNQQILNQTIKLNVEISKSFNTELFANNIPSAHKETFNVQLGIPDDMVYTLSCPDDLTILDAGWNVGLDLPFSCCAGACTTCTMKLEGGYVDQSDQSYLDDDLLQLGFVLSCVAYPTSNCGLKTHQEEELYSHL